MSAPSQFAAFEKARGIHKQQSAGLRISPTVYPALLRELCSEMELLLEENRQLRKASKPSQAAEHRAGK